MSNIFDEAFNKQKSAIKIPTITPTISSSKNKNVFEEAFRVAKIPTLEQKKEIILKEKPELKPEELKPTWKYLPGEFLKKGLETVTGLGKEIIKTPGRIAEGLGIKEPIKKGLETVGKKFVEFAGKDIKWPEIKKEELEAISPEVIRKATPETITRLQKAKVLEPISLPKLGKAESFIQTWSESFLPSKAALIALDKITITPPSIDEKEIAEKYPGVYAIGKGAGELANFYFIGKLTPAIGISKYVPFATVKPSWARALDFMAHGFATGAIKGFFSEVLNQFKKEEFKPANIIKETAKTGAYVGLIATPSAAISPFIRIGGTGLTAAGLSLLESAIENKKLTAEDATNALLDSVVMMLLTAAGTWKAGERYKIQEFQDFQKNKLKTDISSRNPNLSPKEVENIIESLGILSNINTKELITIRQVLKEPLNYGIASELAMMTPKIQYTYANSLAKNIKGGMTISEAVKAANLLIFKKPGVEVSEMPPAPVPKAEIPKIQLPTAPVPTAPVPTAPVLTAPVLTAPVLPAIPVPKAPVPTAPVPKAPVPTAPTSAVPKNEWRVEGLNEKTKQKDGSEYVVKFQKSRVTGKITAEKYIIDNNGEEQFVDGISLEKAQEKYQSKDPEIIANRIINPFIGYNYQTESYTEDLKSTVPTAPVAPKVPKIKMPKAEIPKIQLPTAPVPTKEPLKIIHFTKSENINSILSEGFDTTKAPIHGVGGLEGGEKTKKAADEVLYFTTDKSRWNTATVFVGEGKGNISRNVYDYENQKWKKEINAYKKINLSPLEATVKADAKILTIDGISSAEKVVGKISKYEMIQQIIDTARKDGYDIVNIKDPGGTAWEYPDGKTNKFGNKNWYDTFTGNSGKSDYFILNKNVLELPKKVKLPKIKIKSPIEKFKPLAKMVEKGIKSATIGKFADDAEVKLGNMDKIRPVEFPELVELVNDLTGRVPEVSKRLRKALGKFYTIERGRIKLRSDLFKKENSNQLAKTLAHEIGHLVDYLPHETLKRGNLLGSLLSLRSFLKNQYGSTEITNKEIKEELKAVSKYWRPWEEANATLSYKNYRNSARELYADAISVLLNTPGTLETMAPKFYESFFKYLDEKPEVKNAYFDLQEVLSHDRATLIQLRRERVKEMFDRADYKAKELQEIKEKERKIRLKDFWEMFTYGVKSINQPVYNKTRQLQKQGVYIQDEMNPEYLLSGRNYLSGLVKGEFKENVQPIMKNLFENDIDWKTFGEFLYYERVIAGDRSEFANPRGITPKAAEELRESIKESLGNKYKILEENADKFRRFLKRLATEAYEQEMFTDEMFDLIKGNEKYVPFQVLEYMENYVAWKTKPQVGTLKDITNPANSLLLKAVSTIRAIERQKSRIATFKMLEQGYPDEIKEAELQFTGKAQRPIPSRDPNFEMVTYYKEGKLRGKYVDPYIAKSLEGDTIATNRAVMTMFSPLKYLNRKLFRPIFVVYNPGWIPFNFIRDFMRFWKNTPGLTMYRALKLYGKALRPARVRGFAKERIKPKEIEAEALITKLEKEQILSITWNDFLMGQTAEDVQIETIFEKMGLAESKKEIPTISKVFEKIFQYTGIKPVLNWIRNTGSMIETLPKVAGYYELEGKMNPQEMRTFIRRNIGSPDFFEKGYLTAATNDVFLFSNAFIQAVSADVDIAVSPKTRSGFWWKTAKVTFLPKILQYLAYIGVFGLAIKKMYEDASEYDLTNYFVIPIGRDSKNGKTIYARLPTDETSRLLGGVLWKTMTGMTNDQSFMRDVGDIASLFGGQLPSLSPAIKIPLSTSQFAAGKNPYDSFRGREVLTEQELKAGGWYASKPFLLWQFQQMGGNIFMKMYAGERTPTEKSIGEKLLQSPIISNVVGRFIKISDYGAIEKHRKILGPIQQERARRSIDENITLNDYIGRYQKEEGTETELRKKMIEDILGHYPPKGSEEEDRAIRLKKKFKIGILKGKADTIINSFISAQTNEEKLTLLKVFKEDMSESEFLELRKTLWEYKIVSTEVFDKLKSEK